MAEHFDALVIGRSVASAFAAALLARRKLRVRLIEPVALPAVPWPVLGLGLKGSPIVRRVLDELGLLHATRTRLAGPPINFGVALHDRRFDFEFEVAARGLELGRAFPEHRSALLAIFDRIEAYGGCLDALLDGEMHLPPSGFAERRQVRRLLAELPVAQLASAGPPIPPPLQGLLAALYALVGRPEDPTAGLTAGATRALYLLCQGAATFRSGLAGLRTQVTEKHQAAGGELETRRRAARLLGRDRLLEALEMSDGHRVTADAFVFGDDDDALSRLLGRAPDGLAEGRSAEGAGLVFTLNHLPANLRSTTAWQDQPGQRACLVERDGARLRVWSPTGRTPDLRALIDDLEVTPEGVPFSLCPPCAGPTSDPLALWAPEPATAPRNLFRVGAAVLPGLGLEGEAITAWHAARRVESRLHGSALWPFGRR